MRKLLLGASALALSMGHSGAMAQDAAAQDQANERDDDIIIVTATRRAEDVQDIPIAVTAVTPEQLDKQGVVSVQNITQVSPSFSTSSAQIASGSVVLRIRGVGTTSNNIGFESAVGIFVDGAYQSRPGVALSEFVDIERVEVLRGPQGTLFGRNTSAGALNITTNRPDLNEFGGFANATYGNLGLINVQGAINAPLVEDTLAVRLTGAYRERDGDVDVVDASGTKIGESGTIDQFLVRAQLGYESEGGVKVRLIGDFTDSSNGCCSAIELLADSNINAVIPALGGPANAGMAGPTVATSAFDVTTAEQALDNRIATADRPPLANVEQWGVTAELEFPLGDNADFVFIGSYRDFQSSENYDSDFSGLDVFDVDQLDVDIETITAEARIQGEALGGSLSWLIGGFYSDETINSLTDFSLGDDYDLLVGAIFGGAVGPAPLQLLTGAAPNLTTSTNQYSQSAESWSVFTHNTLDITDALSVTLGLRYSDESKTGGFQQIANNNPACDGAFASVGAGAVPAPLIGGTLALSCFAFVAPARGADGEFFPLPREFNVPFSDNELIYTGKVSYQFAAPITAYASFTHGYKAGGINLDITANTGGADPTFLSEEVDAYEVGVKAKLIDDAVTLNIAGFHEEFTNFQVLEFTGAQFTTFNVASAKSTGIEIESLINPTDDLSFNLGLTYTNARYPSDCDVGSNSDNVTALCGNSLTNAPEFVGIAGINYDTTIGNYLRGFFSGQVRMESDRRTSSQAVNPANLAARQLVPFDVQDGTAKINLRAGIGADDRSWTVEVWGVNVTDVATRGVTFNTVLRGSSRSAFAQSPATYGVTVRTEF
jgi:outer membrane receptor protein involved in Fe transport